MESIVKLVASLYRDPCGSGCWGDCPECYKKTGVGRKDAHECRNLGREHWFFCKEHRVAWNVGSNLMSSWRMETMDDWKENARYFDDNGFRMIDEWHPPPAWPLRIIYRVKGWLRRDTSDVTL
jgi:hypothetical protein